MMIAEEDDSIMARRRIVVVAVAAEGVTVVTVGVMTEVDDTIVETGMVVMIEIAVRGVPIADVLAAARAVLVDGGMATETGVLLEVVAEGDTMMIMSTTVEEEAATVLLQKDDVGIVPTMDVETEIIIAQWITGIVIVGIVDEVFWDVSEAFIALKESASS